jgi:hypothetical protein
MTIATKAERAARRAAPKPAQILSGDQKKHASDEGLS